MKNKIKIIVYLIALTTFANAQIHFGGVTASAGIGNIQSNSPSLTTIDFQGGIFLSFTEKIDINFNYFYSRKVEFFLPENRINRYYPFVQGVSAIAMLYQTNGKFLFKEGIGLAYVRDGIFYNYINNSWGLAFSFALGLLMHEPEKEGWEIGVLTGLLQTFGPEALRRINAGVYLRYAFNPCSAYSVYR